MFNYRKSATGLVVILGIIVVLFFIGWLINLSQRECKTNKDCGSEAYCGSDFSCHQYPIIEKTVVKYNLVVPAAIVGIAIVIAAIIFRRTYSGQKAAENENAAKPEESEAAIEPEPYYKREDSIKTP